MTNQSYDGYELIVVDGGSSDQTVELSEKYADRVIVSKGSIGVARNIGAKKSRGEILAFIDADTIASRLWLKAISESFNESEVVGATGPTFPRNKNFVDNMCYQVSTVSLPRILLSLGIPHIGGLNCAYRREPFMRVGGFDEANALSEDVRLSFRIKRFGNIHFNNKMVAFTSTRRIERYGYPYLVSLYLLNVFLTLLTGKSLRNYPPVRSAKVPNDESFHHTAWKKLAGERQQ